MLYIKYILCYAILNVTQFLYLWFSIDYPSSDIAK